MPIALSVSCQQWGGSRRLRFLTDFLPVYASRACALYYRRGMDVTPLNTLLNTMQRVDEESDAPVSALPSFTPSFAPSFHEHARHPPHEECGSGYFRSHNWHPRTEKDCISRGCRWRRWETAHKASTMYGHEVNIHVKY